MTADVAIVIKVRLSSQGMLRYGNYLGKKTRPEKVRKVRAVFEVKTVTFTGTSPALQGEQKPLTMSPHTRACSSVHGKAGILLFTLWPPIARHLRLQRRLLVPQENCCCLSGLR